LRFLGHGPAAIGGMWRETARTIAHSGGLVSILTHCERGFSGNPGMLAAYRDFLHWITDLPDYEVVRPADLVDRLDRMEEDGDARVI
jgi:hypothetical protein